MLRKIAILMSLLFCANLQIFSQPVCRNTKADSKPGATERFVYKTYKDFRGNEKELNIAVVRPSDNLPEKKRPLVIGLQGSGFADTCFFEPCYIKYSETVLKPYFIPQGFVTASIQYRLHSPLNFHALQINDEKIKEIHYNAVQDAREAVKYIFENADKLGVDTENVFLVGTSAGAITSLQYVFLDDEEIPKKMIEAHGKLEKREKIKAVISLSGAMYDLSNLQGEDKTPLMIVHGRDDTIVPFEKGVYLGIKQLTPVFGGKSVYDEALKQGIPAKGYFYDFGHANPSASQKEIFKNANDFINSYLTCK